MFGFRKSPPKEPSTRDIVNVLGYILQNRPTIINYGEVGKTNIYTGAVIGKAFAEDRQRLDDEFNALAVLLAYRSYIACEVPKEKVDQALRRLFDEFLKDEAFKDRSERDAVYEHMAGRVNEYLSAGDMVELARKVTDNIAAGEEYRWRKESAERFAEQLTGYERSMLAFIQADIKADAKKVAEYFELLDEIDRG